MAKRKNAGANSADAVVALLARAIKSSGQANQSNQKSNKRKQGKKHSKQGVTFPLALPGDLRPSLSQHDYEAIKSGIITCMNHGAGLMRFNGSRVDFSVDLTPDPKLLDRIAAAASPAAT
nr:MAG: N protein [Jingmen shrew arterivirus 1]